MGSDNENLCLEVQSQDQKKTVTRPDPDRSGPQIIKTNEDHNRGPVYGLSHI